MKNEKKKAAKETGYRQRGNALPETPSTGLSPNVKRYAKSHQVILISKVWITFFNKLKINLRNPNSLVSSSFAKLLWTLPTLSDRNGTRQNSMLELEASSGQNFYQNFVKLCHVPSLNFPTERLVPSDFQCAKSFAAKVSFNYCRTVMKQWTISTRSSPGRDRRNLESSSAAQKNCQKGKAATSGIVKIPFRQRLSLANSETSSLSIRSDKVSFIGRSAKACGCYAIQPTTPAWRINWQWSAFV